MKVEGLEGVWKKSSNLRGDAKWRKWIGIYREGGTVDGVGRGMHRCIIYRWVGYGGTPGVTREFRENSEKFPESTVSI